MQLLYGILIGGDGVNDCRVCMHECMSVWLSQVHDNWRMDLCNTYPRHIVLPAAMALPDVIAAASFR